MKVEVAAGTPISVEAATAAPSSCSMTCTVTVTITDIIIKLVWRKRKKRASDQTQRGCGWVNPNVDRWITYEKETEREKEAGYDSDASFLLLTDTESIHRILILGMNSSVKNSTSSVGVHSLCIGPDCLKL